MAAGWLFVGWSSRLVLLRATTRYYVLLRRSGPLRGRHPVQGAEMNLSLRLKSNRLQEG